MGKPGYDSTGRVAGMGDSATGGLYSSDVAKLPENAGREESKGSGGVREHDFGAHKEQTSSASGTKGTI
jgi:hypothetical protein